MTGRMLTTSEVAERLGVCSKTVVRLIETGQLPAIDVRVGTVPRWSIAASDLDDFIARRSRTKSAPV